MFTLLLKVLEKLSLRKLEAYLKEILPKVPDYTTLHYRFRKIENTILESFIYKLAKEIMKILKVKKFYCLVV